MDDWGEIDEGRDSAGAHPRILSNWLDSDSDKRDAYPGFRRRGSVTRRGVPVGIQTEGREVGLTSDDESEAGFTKEAVVYLSTVYACVGLTIASAVLGVMSTYVGMNARWNDYLEHAGGDWML
jgi:hypothetical protein